MKKTLIASAVAAAALAPSAFAMDPASELAARLDSMPTIYGNIQLAWAYQDVDAGAGAGGSDYEFADNGSTIGFKHDHEIAPGVTGFFKAEFEFEGDGEAKDIAKGQNAGLDQLDEAYIGAKGDFGQVWIGKDDSQYENWVDDAVDHFEALGYSGSADSNLGNAETDSIFYNTPSFGGVTVGVAYQVNGQSGPDGAPKTRDNLIVGAQFQMDALTAALVVSNNEGDATGSTVFGGSVAYEVDAFKVAAAYETEEDNAEVFTLLGTYSMGANVFALSYSMGEEDVANGDENSVITAQALHNLSDNMYVYVEGQWEEVDTAGAAADPENKTLVLGATYVF